MSGTLPPGAHPGEIVGGADDGQRVAVIDSRDVAFSLVIGFDGNVALTGSMPKADIPAALRQIAEQLEAHLKAGAP